MDKHERPYRCKELGCIKRQGFTYSGGLLRHEREVHRKQSSLEKLFFCPHETCKRSSGKGFARRENLKEHMRRIHLEEPTTALLTQNASMNHTQHTGSKRKRKDTGVHREAEEGSDPILRAELKRLPKENKQMAQKKKRLTKSIDNAWAHSMHTLLYAVLIYYSEAPHYRLNSHKDLYIPNTYRAEQKGARQGKAGQAVALH